jgi:putative acetyltransferase
VATGVKIQLRPVTEDDLPTFFEQQRDPEALLMADVPARDRNAFIAHWLRILSNEIGLIRAVIGDGKLTGNVVSFERAGVREVGYWIGREYWGKGIATEALAQFLRLETVRPLYARVARHNLGSLRVLLKNGFEVTTEELGSIDPPGEEVHELILVLNARPEIRREALASPSAKALIAALNEELVEMYPDPRARHFGLEARQVEDDRGAFLVAYRGTAPIGCGAVRLVDAETAEIKRMYVVPAERRNGVGRALLEELEREARRLGARRLILETGTAQHAAIALYRRHGFETIPLYGEYLQSPETSLCLGKDLESLA